MSRAMKAAVKKSGKKNSKGSKEDVPVEESPIPLEQRIRNLECAQEQAAKANLTVSLECADLKRKLHDAELDILDMKDVATNAKADNDKKMADLTVRIIELTKWRQRIQKLNAFKILDDLEGRSSRSPMTPSATPDNRVGQMRPRTPMTMDAFKRHMLASSPAASLQFTPDMKSLRTPMLDTPTQQTPVRGSARMEPGTPSPLSPTPSTTAGTLDDMLLKEHERKRLRPDGRSQLMNTPQHSIPNMHFLRCDAPKRQDSS
eukprot:GEMP01084946.1.p1 GENE.GEMP01084946.1~~GEMP01084946.1.p1  ORF type:complete len:270 (+),score=56.45 GEMP01084946.1:32-811(+)